MTHSRDTSKEGRRFSLFSAFNGLLERAKSSAEQESQRLFTSPTRPIKKKRPPRRKQHELNTPKRPPTKSSSPPPSVTSSILPVPLSAMTLQSTASTTTAVSEQQQQQPPPPTPSKDSSMVERERLEKVERELNRLKKIIASLLPDELNEDDLRSVYRGEPDGDVVARLMRIQRQGQERRERLKRFNGVPQAPPPPPPPPPPPAAPAAPPPPPPQIVSQKQQTLASIISQKPAKPLKRRPAAAPVKEKKPRTDPGIMSQLLEEMKHHRLRSVKKPRDM